MCPQGPSMPPSLPATPSGTPEGSPLRMSTTEAAPATGGSTGAPAPHPCPAFCHLCPPLLPLVHPPACPPSPPPFQVPGARAGSLAAAPRNPLLLIFTPLTFRQSVGGEGVGKGALCPPPPTELRTAPDDGFVRSSTESCHRRPNIPISIPLIPLHPLWRNRRGEWSGIGMDSYHSIPSYILHSPLTTLFPPFLPPSPLSLSFHPPKCAHRNATTATRKWPQ